MTHKYLTRMIITNSPQIVERPEHVSGAENPWRKRSSERVWEILPERERSVEREAVERERSSERAKLAAHIPLQCNSSQIS